MSLAARNYAEQLVSRGYGLPLWYPEPSKFGEVEIGDVGFVDDGSFIRLFNALHPADHPMNARGVPEQFSILAVNGDELLHTNDQYLPPGPVCTATTTFTKTSGGLSTNIVDASYMFSCHDNQGTIALLGNFGRQKRFVSNYAFRDYIQRNHSLWCDFAKNKGYLLQPSSIVLISGWLKTSEWALATFSNPGRSHSISFCANAGSYASANFNFSTEENVQMSVDKRAGPPKPASNHLSTSSTPNDQSLFIRYYKMKSFPLGISRVVTHPDSKDVQGDQYHGHLSFPRLSGTRGQEKGSWGRLFQGRDNSDSSRDATIAEDSNEYDIEEVPEPLEQFQDPVDCILDYILNNSTAQTAIASYEDVYKAFPPLDWPRDPALYIAANSPEIIVDEEGVGQLVQRPYERQGVYTEVVSRTSTSNNDNYASESIDTLKVASQGDLSSTEVAIIAVMGPSGSGKTTFINMLSGSELAVGSGLKSCTTAVSESKTFDFNARRVALIDTPGFDDTSLSDTDVLRMIAQYLSTSYKNGVQLSGIIYMHRISDFRVGGVSRRNFSMFRKLCGEDTLKNVVIVTNMWGEVSPEQGAARERELQTDDMFFKPAMDKGAQMVRHINAVESGHAILRCIVHNKPLPLLMQTEMVDEGSKIVQTEAGLELYRELENSAQRYQEELTEVRKEMVVALMAKDAEAKQELEGFHKEVIRTIQKIEYDRDRLLRDCEPEK